MRNFFKLFGIIALVAVIVLGFASCGRDDPKKLAQESYDLSIQALGAVLNPSKTAELAKKATDIQAKVDKLSEADKAIYAEELARLSGAALDDLFNAAGGLLRSLGQ